MADNSGGFIVLYRKMIGWEWYTDNNVKSVFLHCLLRANHKDNEWRGIIVERGSFITSYGKMAQELNLSVKQIRLALDKLKRTGEVATKSTNKYSVITVLNYTDYQDKDKQKDTQEDIQKANKGQTKGKQRATNNNDNNVNNDNNDNKSSGAPLESVQQIVDVVSKDINPNIGTFDIQLIQAWTEEHPLEIILEAIKETALNKVTNIKYTDAILRNWKKQNIRNLVDLESYKSKRAPKGRNTFEASEPEWLEQHEQYRGQVQEETEPVDVNQLENLLKSFKKEE